MSVAASEISARPQRKRRFTFTVLDGIVIAIVVAVLAYVAYRVTNDLVYAWDWGRVLGFFFKYDAARERWLPNLLIEGVFILARICFWAALLGLVIGFLMGVCRTSNVLFFRLLARGYVEFVRNMPPIPFLFIMFFFVGNQILKPLELTAAAQQASPLFQDVIFVVFGDFNVLRNFAAAVIALALYEGAYITEIVRAGIQSLERGQWEAGQSLGLTRYQQLRYIILPQAVQRITPPLANQSIQLIKDSALVSLLSVQELSFMGMEIAHSTSRFFETWIIIAAMYFGICYALAAFFSRLEQRMRRGRAAP